MNQIALSGALDTSETYFGFPITREPGS